MRQRWTLQIEKMGKLQDGRIEIAPLLLLIGDNNSGKSYMLTVLWGFLTHFMELFPKTPPTSDTYQRCLAWFNTRAMDDEFVLDANAQSLFINWVNDALKRTGRQVVRRTFNHDVAIGSMTSADHETAGVRSRC